MEMIRSNENQIKAKFADLALKVRKVFEACLVAASDVRQFLIDFFQQKECFQSASSVEHIFIATSAHHLWDYQNYGPLEVLTKQFLPNNETTDTLVTEYKASLTGFYLFTKLLHYIRHKELEPDDSDEQELSIKKLTSKQYRRIKVVLALDRNIKDLSLDYVFTLWSSFADEYGLPSLTATLETIAPGSLQLTWLILPRTAMLILPRSKFFRKHCIIQVFIDDVILYDEKLMVSLL